MDEADEPVRQADSLDEAADAASDDGVAETSAPVNTLAPDDDDLVGLGTKLAEISTDVTALRALVEERLTYDATKETAFRELYDDLERFRGLASGAQHKPMLLDIVLLLDRVEKGLEAQPEDGFLASIRDELSEILARRGVSAIATPEDRFDPQHQRAVGTRPTPDESAHNTVAEIARTGYEWDGQILRATEVIVYRHTDAMRQRHG